ncbi:OmpA family protein [Vibrio campbellii]|uniref:OmpA family protein n=1 Tax=Vibrio campbellii TaxID=680 RepID=UPI00210A8C9F|nr:OmpA family protein [Vibrio campbellii]UTZ36647.1 OmpA family protein [Vibrio campbellii]
MRVIFLIAALVHPFFAWSAPYIGAKAGKAWSDFVCEQECDEDANNLGLMAGYQFDENWALEMNIDYFDPLEFENNQIPSQSNIWLVGVAPKLTIPLSGDFNLYTKLGVAAYQFDNDTQYSYMGGFGMDVILTPNLKLDIGYQAVPDLDVYDAGDGILNSVTLGLIYEFKTKANTTAPKLVSEQVVQPQPPTLRLFPKTTEVVNYANNSVDIETVDMEKVDYIADILKSYPMSSVVLRGYADSIGSNAYNLTLSKRRAEQIMQVLLGKGISKHQITIKYLGESQPVESNATPEGRYKNRRVEMLIPEFEYQFQQ